MQELKRLYQQTCDDLASEVESAAAARAASTEAQRKSMTDQASAATAWEENNELKASTAHAIEVCARTPDVLPVLFPHITCGERERYSV